MLNPPNILLLTVGEFKENIDTPCDHPNWEHQRKYVCPSCSKAREEGWHLAQHWESAWGNGAATCLVSLKSTQIVAYLFQNWDWGSDPSNGYYGRTQFGRLINGLFEEDEHGYYIFKRDEEIHPLVEDIVEQKHVRPDNVNKEDRLEKRYKDKPSSASSEAP